MKTHRRRRVLLAGLLVCLLPAPGCFVLDILDEGEKEMERYAPSEPAPAAAKPATSSDVDPITAAREAQKAWWGKVRSFTPGEQREESGIVRCQLGGSVQFMDRSNCQARGGRPS